METITIQVLDVPTNTLVDKVLEVVRTEKPVSTEYTYDEYWRMTDTQYIQDWIPVPIDPELPADEALSIITGGASNDTE